MGSFGKYKIHIFSMHHFFSRTNKEYDLYQYLLPRTVSHFNSRTHVRCDRKYIQKQTAIFIQPAYICNYLPPFLQQRQYFLMLYLIQHDLCQLFHQILRNDILFDPVTDSTGTV